MMETDLHESLSKSMHNIPVVVVVFVVEFQEVIGDRNSANPLAGR
jgi:hypothetical protein